MLDRTVHFVLTHRLATISCALLFAGAGIWASIQVPIDAFPDVTNNQVQVLTDAPGLSPLEVERLVTHPLESALTNTPNLVELRSVSRFGLSLITVVFEDGVDVLVCRQLIGERLREAAEDLPPGNPQPELGPIQTGMGEVYQYTVSGDSVSLMERRTLQDRVITPLLRTIPGVSEVTSYGGLVQQYHVEADPHGLSAYGLTMADLFHALSQATGVVSGNYIEHRGERYIVRGVAQLSSATDLETVVVSHRNGVPTYVKDVAAVRVGADVREGAITENGRGESVGGLVIMLRGKNSRDVIQRVKQRVAEINKTLPPGVRIEPYYDQTTLVEKTIRTVSTNLTEGCLLVILILALFLGQMRAALLVAAVIPLSLLGSFIGMKWLGLSANLMTLGALDFGIIVDGSVVMVENMLRRLRLHRNEGRAMHHEIGQGAREVARPLMFGALIVMIVYLPILTLQGIEGKLFRPMAITVLFALATSLVLMLTVIPAAASLLFQDYLPKSEPHWQHRLTQCYHSLLRWHFRRPVRTVLVAVLAFGGSLLLVPQFGTEFLPELDEGDVLVQPIRLPSISMTESIRLSLEVEKILLRFPEVNHIVGRLGRPELAIDPMGVNLSDEYVILKPREKWRHGLNKTELVQAMQESLEVVPGVGFNFTQPIAMRVDELVSGVKSDVAVKLFGDDLPTLERKASEIARVLATIPGASDITVEQTAGQAYLTIKVRPDALAQHGVSAQAVLETIEIAIAGKVATTIREGMSKIDVLVRYTASAREHPERIRTIPVVTESGAQIPLGELADVILEEGPAQVSREMGMRRVAVETNVRGRDVGSFVDQARGRIDEMVALSPGYRIAWGGQFENQQRATKRLMIILPAAILLIFGMLYLAFRGSCKDAALVFVNLPFALTGGFLALWLRGMPFSVSAAIGFIALFGVAVLNGVVMVTAIRTTLAQRTGSIEKAVLDTATMRLRPILMTALVASFGFIPMALSTGTGAEVQKPLATVVIGGLVSSTLLTLIVLPTIYSRLHSRGKTHE